VLNTYAPGSWSVLVGRDLTFFVESSSDSALVGACWQLLDGEGGVDDVLGLIVHEGLRAVGAFALASRDRLLVRGSVSVELVGSEGECRKLEPTATPTWHEPAIGPDVAAVRLSSSGAAADVPTLPLSHGIALASVVTVVRAVGKVSAPTMPCVDRAAPNAEPPPAPAPKPPAVMVSPPDRVNTSEPGEASQLFDELFAPSRVIGTTPVEEATTRLKNLPSVTPRSQPVPRPVSPEPSYAGPPPTGVIDHLPWAPVGRGPVRDVPQPPRRQPDSGMTIRRPRGTSGRGATVSAVRCPVGHLNPSGTTNCRVCRAIVTDREAFETQRPRLGVLLLSTDADPIPLDRGIVLGRAPSAEGDLDRIALQRPDISSNHVEVRIEGWRVLVVDLGSTNGTAVVTPDGRLSDLAPHTPVELHHGSEVVLSDEIRFRFEVTS